MDKELLAKMRWPTNVPNIYKAYPDIKNSIGDRLSEMVDRKVKRYNKLDDEDKKMDPMIPYVKNNMDVLAKYIILLYHTKSPLIVIDNFVDRQKEVCNQLGINMKDPCFISLTSGEEEEFNYAIIDFVALENNPKYQLLISNEEVYRSTQADLMQSGKDQKKRVEALMLINELAETIDRLKLAVFSNDRIVGSFVSSHLINTSKRKISPEDYALE